MAHPGPSRTIIVEPITTPAREPRPATAPPQPPAPPREAPAPPRREPVPA